MKTVKLILLGLFLVILNTEMYAADKYINNMMVLNENDDSDVAEIEMRGNGESCRLSFGSNGVIYNTSCRTMVNSKGVKIYCTSKKKLCKTYDEIYTFIFNLRPKSITFRGVISGSAFELDDDGVIWFSPKSNNAKVIFDSCKSGEYCEVTGIVNDGYLISVDSVNSIRTNNHNVTPSSKITWEKLGIGLHNKGEIGDWTYFGIKTPQEASEWIGALKSLGGDSYAGVARLWKQNGFTPQEAKSWILLGIDTPKKVRYWMRSGVKNAREVEQWKDVGIQKQWKVSQWIQAGVSSPEKAKEWIDADYPLNDAKKQIEKGYLSPLDVAMAKEESTTMEKNIPHEPVVVDNPIKMTNDDEQDWNVKADDYESDIANHDVVVPTEYQSSKQEKSYQGFLLVYFIVMIVTMFKGYGENRSVVIFRDYDDLGLTFLIPASFVLIYYLFLMFGGNPALGAGLALVVSIILFFLLLKNTYEDNHKKVFPTILSIMTKVPLGMIWILSFITMLNPSGKTAKERRKNRGMALLIMGILTPIIGMLVVEKEGSLFNPIDWIKGKRIGSIRNHL